MKKLVFIADIDTKNSPKVRIGVDDEVVEEYSKLYALKGKCPLPPPIVYDVDGNMVLADGMHRISAAKKAGLKALPCEVTKGSYEDCLKVALIANVQHGLRRSNADKHACVTAALKQWPDATNVDLSERCLVDEKTVRNIRGELEKGGDIAKTEVRIRKDKKQIKVPPKGKAKEENATSDNPTKEPKAEPKAEPKGSENPTASSEELDGTKFPIPGELLSFWSRRVEVNNLLNNISSVRTAVTKAQTTNDPMFAEVVFTGVLADLSRVYDGLKAAVPHAVCPTCQGKLNAKCRMCKGRGFVSEFYYKIKVPDELKKVREIARKAMVKK